MSRAVWAKKALVAIALSVGLTSTSVAVAQADTGWSHGPNDNSPSATIKPGEAYMGWRNHAPASRAQQVTSTSSGQMTIAATGVYGIDVASYQGNVNWSYWWGQGRRFAFVKATQGTTYKNPFFAQQYVGSYNQGFIRGSYHFATPSPGSNGATQADYFVNNGGAWSRDGKTLPGVLDIEFNPNGANCYGMTDAQMVTWISQFVARYKARTSRDAVIYTNRYWWEDCTGNTTKFSTTNPLWISNYVVSSNPPRPGGWPFYTFWQYADRYAPTGASMDQNVFNGSYDRLVALANG